ncbi:hypothetical protein Tco_1569386 [Tanacetum coccineum]
MKPLPSMETFKELLMKSPQHYLMEMHEVILFYNGLGIPTRQILDSRGAIPFKTDADAKIKKVNEKVYVAQVGCEQRKGPHYTKDCPLKEEGKTREEAYYTQFGRPFQGGGYRAAAPGFYQRNNANLSYQERRQSMEDTLSKFMSESAKRHEENSNLIKEIHASRMYYKKEDLDFHRMRCIQLSVQYSVFIQLINTTYSLPLDTAYRSSGAESLVFLFDFCAKFFYLSSEQILLIFLPLLQDILVRASRLKKVMTDKGKKSSMETFAPNDKADYYSWITSITVNGKMLMS